MGSRYVWGKYKIVSTNEIDVKTSVAGAFRGTVYFATDYIYDIENKTFTLTGTIVSSKRGSSINYDPTVYRYLMPDNQIGSELYYVRDSLFAEYTNIHWEWGMQLELYADNSGGTTVSIYNPYDRYIFITTETPGSLIDYCSSFSSGSYPTNAISGSYWYTYKGSDTIDPVSVSYPASPKSTVPITLTVTPSKGNTYGGTVSYQYEVSLDGGNSWNQLGLTTAVTQQYTIPKGTQTFRCRVQARDNLGFTSSDWIYGPQVTVINNSAPTAPGSITVPVSPRGGADTTITWTKSTDVDGNLSGYRLEGQVDGGDWTQLYDGPNLSYVDVIPKGALTAAYRVKAYDSDGEESPYTTSPTRTVINNNPPIITCDLSGDLGIKETGFTVPSASITFLYLPPSISSPCPTLIYLLNCKSLEYSKRAFSQT